MTDNVFERKKIYRKRKKNECNDINKILTNLNNFNY